MDRYGSPAFDGVTALLLSPKKLDLWESMLGYGKANSIARIAKIRQSSGPLKMPYAPENTSSGNDPDSSTNLHEKVPENLYYTAQHRQYALLWKQMLEWEVSIAEDMDKILDAC